MFSEDRLSGNTYPSTNSYLTEQEVSNIMFFPYSLKHGWYQKDAVVWVVSEKCKGLLQENIHVTWSFLLSPLNLLSNL